MDREDLEFDISEALKHPGPYTLAGVTNLSSGDLWALQSCCDYYDEHGTLAPLWFLPKTVTDVLSHYGMLCGVDI